jgi:hypothetical protein
MSTTADSEQLNEDEIRNGLKQILDNINSAGDFCTGKDITASIPRFQPRITVDGMEDSEPLSFPLLTYQAKQLCSVAEKAPFGKGLDTVVDESVRKAWQIDASKVHFQNSSQWQETLNSIVMDCTSSLGMGEMQQAQVEAHLYKMLIYEKGGFFKKHRDTEKEPGMFATLVNQLPSKFTGGELVVQHGGVQRNFDYSSNSHEGFYATAFYADCEHELLPVSDGWRLCLAYNLVMKQQESVSEVALPNAAAVAEQDRKMQELASRGRENFNSTRGYVLEHEYTATNLRFMNLKGRGETLIHAVFELPIFS